MWKVLSEVSEPVSVLRIDVHLRQHQILRDATRTVFDFLLTLGSILRIFLQALLLDGGARLLLQLGKDREVIGPMLRTVSGA
ncbi:hypothetical protein [Roseitranquillus sediminis]|uniref:hypothetical protein n=1 Tax=Roseitranquillus sediminis TaxID=2809051 RepID=UPI001D0CBD47|nr:hypothetical protein [Roseitranquillus sediminis]MBM9594496.1 hypothetical protein [Roseitranquillus sediminis]